MRWGGGIAAGKGVIGTGGCSASLCSHRAAADVPAEGNRQSHSSKAASASAQHVRATGGKQPVDLQTHMAEVWGG